MRVFLKVVLISTLAAFLSSCSIAERIMAIPPVSEPVERVTPPAAVSVSATPAPSVAVTREVTRVITRIFVVTRFVATQTPAPPSVTPLPSYIDFRSDAGVIIKGGCTTLRWDVEGVQGVYLDGIGQVGHWSMEVCPDATRTYVLSVVRGAGVIEVRVTILVVTLTPVATP